MKRIVFQSNQLSIRGTEIALYDYAHHNQVVLGNESLIAYELNNPANNQQVIEKFSSKFKMLPYHSIENLDQKIENNGIELMYAIKAGYPDSIISKIIPTMVHAVFPQPVKNSHGSSYAFVSDWLSKVCSNHVIPSVPHIVQLPSEEGNLREILNIPGSATVFGSYGGADSFDIQFAKQAVKDAVDKRNDLYFIFLNIKKFIDHERVIFLPAASDLEYKVKFINTCDAMLHARKLGESFGLACGEFSICNKPILTYSKSQQRNHIDILGDKAFLYSEYQSLIDILVDFDRKTNQHQDWDCYSKLFSPERVMKLFNERLIKPALKAGVINNPGLELTFKDQFACEFYKLQLRAIKFSRIWAR